MNTSAPEGRGAFLVKLLLCHEALPSQELLAASSWPGCVKALGVSRRERWPTLHPWVNQGQDALLWTEIMVLKGQSDKRELSNANVPQSSPEVPPEAVTTRHSCVETKCTSWVLLGIAPVLDLSMVQRGKLSRSSNTPYSLLSRTNTSQSIFTFASLICSLRPLMQSLNDRYSCFYGAFFLVSFNNSYSSTPHSCSPFHCSFDN